MLFKENFKRELDKNPTFIKIRGELSGANWLEANITNLSGSSITLGTPVNQLDIRLQVLNSGAVTFSEGNFRIDNGHNSPLHLHCSGAINPVEVLTLSGALLMVLGSDYWGLENE